MGNEDGQLVLRKPWREWRFAVIAVSVVFGLPMIGAAIAAAAAGEWGVVAVVGPVVAVPAVAIAGNLRYSRIVVTPDEIAVRGFVVRRRRPRAAAARVVRATLVQPRGPMVDTVFVLDAAGRLLIRISGNQYARADLDRLIAFLGLPSTSPDRPVTAGQLAAAHPGIVAAYEAHPVRFGLYAAAGAVAAVVIAAVALSVALAGS